MDDSSAVLSFIAILPAFAGAGEPLDSEVVDGSANANSASVTDHSHCHCAGVDSAALVVGGNSLDSVASRFSQELFRSLDFYDGGVDSPVLSALRLEHPDVGVSQLGGELLRVVSALGCSYLHPQLHLSSPCLRR